MRCIRPGPRAVALWMVAPALVLASCIPSPAAAPSQPGTQDSGPQQCTNIQVSALGSEEAPDFAGYGFPRVAATQGFVPGAESTINAPNITLTLPADMYTEPLIFELLVSDPEPWQACVPAGQVVIAPYAYRVRESATNKPVGRFDKPVADQAPNRGNQLFGNFGGGAEPQSAQRNGEARLVCDSPWGLVL
ncbi:MAG: hypothetical protein HW416_3280 [Chloroflexi bacterium]|nr:hypothetical protein [Chloroflexota bacterium]